jgi:hypothetical protein
MTYASIFDGPAYYMTEAEYEATLAEWAAGPGSTRAMINPPEFLWRRPPMRSLPVEPTPDPEPEAPCEPQPQWFFAYGRRSTDNRAYIGLGVIEPDGSEREERYHPAVNTRLYALLERYLTETDDDSQ